MGKDYCALCCEPVEKETQEYQEIYFLGLLVIAHVDCISFCRTTLGMDFKNEIGRNDET